MDWTTAALLGGTTAVVLAAVLPVAGLMGTPAGAADSRLEISTVPGGYLGRAWRDPRTPAGTQRQATVVLFGLLTGMGVAAFATGGITAVALAGARDHRRSSDDQVRRAVGASRRVIRRATLLEASVIAAGGAGIGTRLGAMLGRLAVGGWPGGETVPHHPPVALALVAVTAAVVPVSAMLPLIFARSNRLAEPDRAPRQIFVPALAQFAASLAVLVTAALVGRNAADVESAGSSGTDARIIQLASARDDPAPLARGVLDAAALTGSLTSPGAIAGLGTIAAVTTDCGNCSQGGIPSKFHVFYATHHLVSSDSFQALGIHLVAGRQLRSSDRTGAPPVAVVNRALAQLHFQQGEAVGRPMIVGDDKAWYTVVGVVDDASAWGYGARFQPQPTVYLSILQHPPTNADLLVRPRAGPGVPADARQALAVLEPLGVRLGETSLSRLREREAAPVAWFARWIAAEGWAMLLIACVGMMAVMRIWVRSLLPELGLRWSVGATRASLLLLVVRQAAAVVAAGVVAGCWFGWSVWNVLPTILRGAATWDTGAIAVSAAPLALATFAGAMLPAVRALRATPAQLMSSAD